MVYLLERMERSAGGAATVTFLANGAEERVSWSELYSDAVRVAGFLQASGVGRGRSVVVLALASRSTVTAAMATWLAGGVLTMAPTPARTMDEASFVAETGRRVDRLGDGPLVLVGRPFEHVAEDLAAGGRRRVRPLDEVVGTGAAGGEGASWSRPVLTGEDCAILQLTSGTTASAKTVRISHGNLAANVEAVKEAIHRQVHGRMLSWLPLSHDMGLIGTLVLPMTCGECDVVLSSPTDYLARPASWMRQVSEHRATSIVGPNTAYALAARLLAAGPQLDLSSLRCALSGGEPVDPQIMAGFAAAGARHGLDPGAVLPAYGLAEAVVAVTLSPVGRGLATDTVDADQLDQRHRAVPRTRDDGGRSRTLARLGPPVAGLRLRVADLATGGLLPERRVGEVQLRGTSVTSGYHEDPDGTAQAFTADGWLRTGDLGYLVDGELVVTGRAKDVIILAGRNVYPDEAERAAARADGVRPGNAVAFACPRPGAVSQEGLVIAVETRADDHDAVRAAVTRQVQAALGVTPHEVVVVPAGSLPKTPSGKLQRGEARRLFTGRTGTEPALASGGDTTGARR